MVADRAAGCCEAVLALCSRRGPAGPKQAWPTRVCPLVVREPCRVGSLISILHIKCPKSREGISQLFPKLASLADTPKLEALQQARVLCSRFAYRLIQAGFSQVANWARVCSRPKLPGSSSRGRSLECRPPGALKAPGLGASIPWAPLLPRPGRWLGIHCTLLGRRMGSSARITQPRVELGFESTRADSVDSPRHHQPLV